MKTLVLAMAVCAAYVIGAGEAAAQKVKSKTKTPATTPAKAAITPPAKCGANGLTAAEITDIVAAHNKARAEMKLSPVIWDCKLADLAQEWASKGDFKHRQGIPFGENMFVSSNPTEPISSVVARWMMEKPNWTNATATCAAGKICTHYTQVMWKKTVKIGCGITRSGAVKWKTMVVCNYDPAGNTGGPAY